MVNSNHKNDYLISSVYRAFLVISILTMLSTMTGILVDNIVAGVLLGEKALGAMSIVGPMAFLCSFLNNICATGGMSKAAQAMGKGNKQEFDNCFTIVIIFIFSTGISLTFAGLIFSSQVAYFLGGRDELQVLADEYLQGYLWCLLPNVLVSAVNSFARIDGSINLPLQSILVMTVSDILLDFLFVGYMEGGMFGLGFATTVSYVLALCVSCSHFFKKTNSYRLIKPVNFFSTLMSIMATGFPTAMVRLGETAKWVFLNVLLATFIASGAGAVAALNIRMQVNNVVSAVIIGMGQTTVPIASLFYGEEDRTSLQETLNYSLRIGLFINVVVGVVMCIFPRTLVSLFGVEEAHIVEMSVFAIVTLGISFPLRGINTTFASFYQATRQRMLATIISVLQSFVFVCLIAYLLIFPLGDEGVWWAFVFAEVATFLFVVGYIWWKKGKVPRSLSDFMLFGKNFGVTEDERFEISVENNIDDVVKASKSAYDYAIAKGVDEKRANAVSLLIEEVGCNIVKFAFDDEKKHWLDIVLIYKDNRVVLLFRDNGKAFDPIAYANKNEVGLGLKIVRGIAKRFEYGNILGLNELWLEC